MLRKFSLLLLVAFLALPSLSHANTTVLLPAPTGEYLVGKRLYTVNVDATRDILLHVYYPAMEAGEPRPYIDPEVVAAWNTHPEQPLPGLALLTSTARTDAAPTAELERFPIVLFSPGLGIQPEFYAALLEDLASHGYLVAAINHTHTTYITPFADGRVEMATASLPDTESYDELVAASDTLVAQTTADVQAALNMLESIDFDDPILAGRLNFGYVGMFGHSFGGATAAEAAHLDDRIQVVLDMDGSIFGTVANEGLNKPFMALFAEESATAGGVGALLTNAPDAYGMWIAGSTHYTFVTDVLLLPGVPADLIGTLEPARAVEVIRAAVRSFFDTYLQAGSAPAIFQVPLDYPELTLRTYGS